MDEYWKALINGMTPESKSDLHFFWIIPTGILAFMFIASMFT